MPFPHWSPHTLAASRTRLAATGRVELALLRLDQADPLISGNSTKLAPHLALAREQGLDGLISLGGAHSNHLHALAGAGARFGFRCVGLLRGHEVDTPTVRDLRSLGMELHWLGWRLSPAACRRLLASLAGTLPRLAAGRRGRWRLLGARGCIGLVERIATQLPTLGWDDYDAIWVAAGTGTTLAGLVLGEAGRHPVVGALAVPEDTASPPRSRRPLPRRAGPIPAIACWTPAVVSPASMGDWRGSSSSSRRPAASPRTAVHRQAAARPARGRGERRGGSRQPAGGGYSGGLQGRRALQERLLALL